MATDEDRMDEQHRDTGTTTEDLADTDAASDQAERSSAAVAVEERGDGARRESAADDPSLGGPDTSPEAPLFLDDQRSSYRGRWDEIQAQFVDDPRQAVQDADDLVNTVVSDLESSFKTRRESLEAGWQRGDDVSTEDLRVALQGYRSFFGRLLGD
jgi:hypothetical protein